MNSVLQHIAEGGGVCGTCARPANATIENQGYSSCCNDRIEYDDEAAETVRVANCDHRVTRVEKATYLGLGPDFARTTCDETVCVACGEILS